MSTTARIFVGYRPNPPEEGLDKGIANGADEPQYEGVVFSDGTVCVRWLTEYRSHLISHVIWQDFDTFWKVHGHLEYGTYLKWYEPEQLG